MHIETPESHLDPSQWLVKEEEAKPPQKNLFSSFNSFSKLKTFVQIGYLADAIGLRFFKNSSIYEIFLGVYRQSIRKSLEIKSRLDSKKLSLKLRLD